MARWYQRNGYEVIARHWTMRGGELDVVARRRNVIVVCEVKARRTLAMGHPLESMTSLKQQRVRRAGVAFLATLNESGLTLRFDVASVLGTKLEMFHDCF